MPIPWIKYDHSIAQNTFSATVLPATTTQGFRFEGNSHYGTNTLKGGNGNDTITAKAPECSYVYGMGGDDTIIGNDALLCSYLDGGAGDDSITGGNRTDTIIGGLGT